jgi:hypothetical protein
LTYSEYCASTASFSRRTIPFDCRISGTSTSTGTTTLCNPNNIFHGTSTASPYDVFDDYQYDSEGNTGSVSSNESKNSVNWFHSTLKYKTTVILEWDFEKPYDQKPSFLVQNNFACDDFYCSTVSTINSDEVIDTV